MAYVHQILFEIERDQLGDLGVGSPLQRVIGFLRVRLPDCEGFLTSRAQYSIKDNGAVLVELSSVWDRYADLAQHRESRLAEDKVIEEFGGTVQALRTREFVEVD